MHSKLRQSSAATRSWPATRSPSHCCRALRHSMSGYTALCVRSNRRQHVRPQLTFTILPCDATVRCGTWSGIHVCRTRPNGFMKLLCRHSRCISRVWSGRSGLEDQSISFCRPDCSGFSKPTSPICPVQLSIGSVSGTEETRGMHPPKPIPLPLHYAKRAVPAAARERRSLDPGVTRRKRQAASYFLAYGGNNPCVPGAKSGLRLSNRAFSHYPFRFLQDSPACVVQKPACPSNYGTNTLQPELSDGGRSDAGCMPEGERGSLDSGSFWYHCRSLRFATWAVLPYHCCYP